MIYFLVMEAGGIAHILGDGFTHFSVPPLLPFSDVPLELDADRAINFLTLAVSVASFYLLLGVERNHVPFAWYVLTVYGLMVFYGAYLGIRLRSVLHHPPPRSPRPERGADPDREPLHLAPSLRNADARPHPHHLGPLPTRTRAHGGTLHGRGVDRAVLAFRPSPRARPRPSTGPTPSPASTAG